MAGEKITQLQDAMFTVLDSMNSQDFFSIITFSYGVNVRKHHNPISTSVKLSHELLKITFPTGKPKLTLGEVSTFQGF